MPFTQVNPVSVLHLRLRFVHFFFPDKTGERFYHITVPWWGVILGYIIGVSTDSVGGRYVSMFLMASGYAGS
jgi:hypothetical protein